MIFIANTYVTNFVAYEHFCSSWLTLEQVDKFVIEKYIEISMGISIGTSIMYADPDPYSFSVTIEEG